METRGQHQSIFHKKVLQYSIFGLLFGLLLSICGAVAAFAFLYGEIAILPVGMRLYLYLSGMAVPFFLAGFGAMLGRVQDDLERVRAETREYLARTAVRERKLLHSSLQHLNVNEIIERSKRDEATIRRQQEFLQALVQHNPAGVVITGADRRILFCNPSFEAVFGLTAAEITGQSLEQVLDPEPEAGGGSPLLAGEQAAKHVICCRRKEGAALVVEATQLPWQFEGQDGALWLFSAVPCEPAVPEAQPEADAAAEAPGEGLAGASEADASGLALASEAEVSEAEAVEDAGVSEIAGAGEPIAAEDSDADLEPAAQAPAVLDADGEEAPEDAGEPAPAGDVPQSMPDESLPGEALLSDDAPEGDLLSDDTPGEALFSDDAPGDDLLSDALLSDESLSESSLSGDSPSGDLPDESLSDDSLGDEPQRDSPPIPIDILDVQSALPRFGGDREYYNYLLQDFIAGLPDRLAKMYVALEEGSPSTLALLADDLKGVAANFGASQIVQMAAELYACCEERNLACARQRVVDVTEAAERLKACAAQV